MERYCFDFTVETDLLSLAGLVKNDDVHLNKKRQSVNS